MSNIKLVTTKSIFLALVLTNSALADFKGPAKVTRASNEKVMLEWMSDNPVNVFVATKPNFKLSEAKLLASANSDGKLEVDADKLSRKYFLLVDSKDKKVQKTAERVLSLVEGSNFRDIGGYKSQNGKSVKWGLIFRSGSLANLNEQDLKLIESLKLDEIVDLRSSDERQIAPTKIDGVNYHAVGYSFGNLLPKTNDGTKTDMLNLYRNMPHRFAPQLKLVFKELLAFEGPVLYNCAAGQDRTGFTTAMVLSALGVPKTTIFEDYHLSTIYRVPKNEQPKIDLTLFKDNAAAQMFAHYKGDPKYQTPMPLKTENNIAFLEGAFMEINEKWGSVDNYLMKEIGLSKQDIAKLKLLYLE